MIHKNIFNFFLWFLSFVTLLIAARIVYTGSVYYAFLLWNELLAFIPLGIAYWASSRTSLAQKWNWVAAITWLLFLPNSTYIITDFLHLGASNAPMWYDIVLLYSASTCAMLMGLVSMYGMQHVLARIGLRKSMPLLIASTCLLCGFGVYIGRYLRWNSWDVLSNPLLLLQDCMHRVLNPIEHGRTWGLTVCFAALQYVMLRFLQVWRGERT